MQSYQVQFSPAYHQVKLAARMQKGKVELMEMQGRDVVVTSWRMIALMTTALRIPTSLNQISQLRAVTTLKVCVNFHHRVSLDYTSLYPHLTKEVDRLRNDQVLQAVALFVPEKVYERPKYLDEPLTFDIWNKVYPSLEMVHVRGGDGSSCMFEAVAEAVWGDFSFSLDLRERAVNEILKKWSALGEVALAEVADQVGRKDLCKEDCVQIMKSKDRNGKYLWGNEVMLHCLPDIVGMTIVILSLSSTGAFKQTYVAANPLGTIVVGFVPEVHYFTVRTRKNFPKPNTKGFSILDSN